MAHAMSIAGWIPADSRAAQASVAPALSIFPAAHADMGAVSAIFSSAHAISLSVSAIFLVNPAGAGLKSAGFLAEVG
jgi:hypothetical protein